MTELSQNQARRQRSYDRGFRDGQAEATARLQPEIDRLAAELQTRFKPPAGMWELDILAGKTVTPFQLAVNRLRANGFHVEAAGRVPGLFNVGALRDLTYAQVISLANTGDLQ